MCVCVWEEGSATGGAADWVAGQRYTALQAHLEQSACIGTSLAQHAAASLPPGGGWSELSGQLDGWIMRRKGPDLFLQRAPPTLLSRHPGNRDFVSSHRNHLPREARIVDGHLHASASCQVQLRRFCQNPTGGGSGFVPMGPPLPFPGSHLQPRTRHASCQAACFGLREMALAGAAGVGGVPVVFWECCPPWDGLAGSGRAPVSSGTGGHTGVSDLAKGAFRPTRGETGSPRSGVPVGGAIAAHTRWDCVFTPRITRRGPGPRTSRDVPRDLLAPPGQPLTLGLPRDRGPLICLLRLACDQMSQSVMFGAKVDGGLGGLCAAPGDLRPPRRPN